jgi:hypothetical protein
MTAELRRTCPDCGSIDVEVRPEIIMQGGGPGARCPNCEWNGKASETVGVASSEGFWDIQRVGEVLLRVIAAHGAGPMCQVFEFVGLIEKDDQEARDRIMRAASAACIQAAFGEAQEVHIQKLLNKPESEMNEQEKKLAKAARKRAKKQKEKMH